MGQNFRNLEGVIESGRGSSKVVRVWVKICENGRGSSEVVDGGSLKVVGVSKFGKMVEGVKKHDLAHKKYLKKYSKYKLSLQSLECVLSIYTLK